MEAAISRGRQGYVLVDLLVGLSILSIGLGLGLYAGSQALKSADRARMASIATSALAYRLEAEWPAALDANGAVRGSGWIVLTERTGQSTADGWAICRVTAKVNAGNRTQEAVTYRFCPNR